MPRRPKQAQRPPSGELFGEVVRDLRKSANEIQKQFAARFYVTSSYISNIENGRELPLSFREALIAEFPQSKERIEAAYKRSLQQRRAANPQNGDPPQATIEHLITAGKFTFARHALEEGLAEASDPEMRHWLCEHLATVHMSTGQSQRVVETLQATIDYAIEAGLEHEEQASRDRFATYYQRRADYISSHEVLDHGLGRFPFAAILWLRKGKVHWQEQAFSHAYAALTTAEAYGSTRLSVIHARGQVLAEWGAYNAALPDLEEYLASPNVRLVNTGPVRSARALVWGHTGRMAEAFTEFQEVEVFKPDSPLLYYRRALCHITAQDDESAITDLVQAMKCTDSLTPPRRDHAEALLRERGADVKIPWTPADRGL